MVLGGCWGVLGCSSMLLRLLRLFDGGGCYVEFQVVAMRFLVFSGRWLGCSGVFLGELGGIFRGCYLISRVFWVVG